MLKLRPLIKWMGKAAVVVSGHTCTAGTTLFNNALSKQCAEAASAYLLSKGAPLEMQKIIAMYKTDLGVPTCDEVRESRNRRVVITFGPASVFSPPPRSTPEQFVLRWGGAGPARWQFAIPAGRMDCGTGLAPSGNAAGPLLPVPPCSES